MGRHTVLGIIDTPKKQRLSPVCLAVAWICLLAPCVAFAHHGGAVYDTSKMTTVKGVVTDFQFINPHSQIFFDAKNDKDEVEKWIAEGNSGTALSRYGWKKDSLKPGDQITAIGNRSKNGSTTMHLRKLILASGEELPVDRDFEN
jgi:Family of unknown function (DUF6152)